MEISPYNYVLSKKYEIIPLSSYTTELQSRINKSFEERDIPKNKGHFTVTEIVDPLNYYMKLTHPELNEKTPEMAKRMDMGNRIHSLAESWFSKVDNTVETEVLLDGALKGILLTGKYDAKINGSIYELKSKSVMPENKADIIKHHPNNVEQIVLYSVLDNLHPSINYLVFISQENFSDVKIFKITIKNKIKALEFAQKRISILNKVINGGDPKTLGCCRHCPPNPYEDCPFQSKCLNMMENKIPCGVLDFIEIEEENSEFKNKFIKTINETSIPDYELLRLSDIISPKKLLLKRDGELTDGWKGYSLEEKRNKNYFNTIVHKFNKNISKTNHKEKSNHRFQDICLYRSRFFTYRDVRVWQGEWLPFINHVVKSHYPATLKSPHEYKIAELGILCLIQGYKSGFIFQFYPNLNNQCRVFRINYDFNVEEGQKIIGNAVNLIKNTKLENINDLYDCAFGCDTCPMITACQSKV